MRDDPVRNEPMSVWYLNVVDVGRSVSGDAYDSLAPLAVHSSEVLSVGIETLENRFLLSRSEPDMLCKPGHVLSPSYEESTADYSRVDSKTQQENLDVPSSSMSLALREIAREPLPFAKTDPSAS